MADSAQTNFNAIRKIFGSSDKEHSDKREGENLPVSLVNGSRPAHKAVDQARATGKAHRALPQVSQM